MIKSYFNTLCNSLVTTCTTCQTTDNVKFVTLSIRVDLFLSLFVCIILQINNYFSEYLFFVMEWHHILLTGNNISTGAARYMYVSEV
jgi:hypothetical protein